jgi:hypothetical protein
MPQLDSLTYFSQYVYLVISFVAVYCFLLTFIVPKIVSTFKIRQKLNSLNRPIATKDVMRMKSHYPNSKNNLTLKAASFSKVPLSVAVGTSFSHYENVLYASWAETCVKPSLVSLKSTSPQGFLPIASHQWLTSMVALQYAQTLRFKKLLCNQIVGKIKA